MKKEEIEQPLKAKELETIAILSGLRRELCENKKPYEDIILDTATGICTMFENHFVPLRHELEVEREEKKQWCDKFNNVNSLYKSVTASKDSAYEKISELEKENKTNSRQFAKYFNIGVKHFGENNGYPQDIDSGIQSLSARLGELEEENKRLFQKEQTTYKHCMEWKESENSLRTELTSCEKKLKEMRENMQYYLEYCQSKGYVTPMEWIEKHKHF